MIKGCFLRQPRKIGVRFSSKIDPLNKDGRGVVLKLLVPGQEMGPYIGPD